jgi:hypothetical protein
MEIENAEARRMVMAKVNTDAEERITEAKKVARYGALPSIAANLS